MTLKVTENQYSRLLVTAGLFVLHLKMHFWHNFPNIYFNYGHYCYCYLYFSCLSACFRSALVARLLQHSGLSYTHLAAVTPAQYKIPSTQPHWLLPRGVLQRNAGLAWLRSHLDTLSPESSGVLYFADDDNTYDLRLFDEVSGGKIQVETPNYVPRKTQLFLLDKPT